MTTSQAQSPSPPAASLGPEQIVLVPIEKIRESKTNPRKTIDQADEIELITSIGGSSIVTPLILRQAVEGYEIVDGARRFRAAKALAMIEVPGIIRPYTDDEAYEVQLISFAQRVDIHPLDEADAYTLLEKKKFDIAQISAKVGKERSYIAKRLRLAKLIEPAKMALRQKQIFLEHALLIARLQPRDQDNALEYTLEEGNGAANMPVSVDDLAGYIEQQFELDLRKASFDKKDYHLVEAAGNCVNCPKRSGFNRDLFDDITQADQCMDPTCFELKMKRHLQNVKTRLQDEGKTVILITPDMRKPAGYPESITYKSFKEVKPDSCKHTKAGLVVGGTERGKIRTVCAEKTCRKHWGESERSTSSSSGKPKSPEAQEKERLKKVREEIDAEVDEKLQEAIIPLIAKALPDKLRRIDLERIYGVVESSLYGADSLIKKVLDLKGKPENWPDKQLGKAIGLALIIDRIQNDYDPQDATTAVTAARELKLDVEPIEKEIRVEIEKAHADELKSQLPTNSKKEQPKRDVCRICGCTPKTPCMSKIGIACAWMDESHTLCNNPKCIQWDKKAKTKAKAAAKPKPAAKKKSKS